MPIQDELKPSISSTKEKAFAFCQRSLGELVNVEPVKALPYPAYGFEADGWDLFVVLSTGAFVGGSDYVAVHRTTGEVRHLGKLGE